MWHEPSGEAYVTVQDIHWPRPMVHVPRGFRFNVSVPRLLRWLVDPHDERLLRAACFHDYAIHELGWSRPLSGALWNEVLREEGHFSLSRRVVFFVALSLWKFR